MRRRCYNTFMTDQYDSQKPYVASYMLFKNSAGEIAFLLRSNTKWMDGYYTLPAGKVDHDEFASECAIRESKEEVGVTVRAQDIHPAITVHRMEADGPWLDVYFEVKAWEGELVNAEPEKHGELRWFSPNTLPKNVLPNVVHALEQIKAGNTYTEFNRR